MAELYLTRELFKSSEGPFGYRRSRFVDEVPDWVLCRFCSNVVRSPTECIECGVLYCKYCSIFMEKSECLVCRSICKVKVPSKRLRKHLGKLRIQCMYGPCTAVTSLQGKKEHQVVCIHKQVMCTRHGCVNMGSRKDFIPGIGSRDEFCSEKCKVLHEFRRALLSNQKQVVLTLYQAALVSTSVLSNS